MPDSKQPPRRGMSAKALPAVTMSDERLQMGVAAGRCAPLHIAQVKTRRYSCRRGRCSYSCPADRVQRAVLRPSTSW